MQFRHVCYFCKYFVQEMNKSVHFCHYFIIPQSVTKYEVGDKNEQYLQVKRSIN